MPMAKRRSASIASARAASGQSKRKALREFWEASIRSRVALTNSTAPNSPSASI
jgi:hypothetical protein